MSKNLGPHREDLLREVATAYQLGPFRIFLQNRLGKVLDHLARPGTDPERIAEVFLKAEQEGWIEPLLRELKQDRAGVPEIGALVDRIIKGWGMLAVRVPPDPYQTFVTSQGTFVDRESTRHLIREMNEPVGDRLLLLRGEKGTGKTYTWHFVKWVADQEGFQAVLVDLVRWPSGATARDVVENMVSQLGRRELVAEFDAYARDPRRAVQLAFWFANVVKEKGARCWIFVDHLNKVAPPTETMDLLLELVRLASDDIADLRIVLCGLGEEQSQFDEFNPARDRAPGVQREDVARHVQAVAKFLGAELQPQTVDEAVGKIFELVTAGNQPSLPRGLAMSIYKVVKGLLPQVSP